ncbi:LacI family DNA-binding transcriptional regulator [Rathayibacter soli]|uniref:LacI family DNA-binding transcriptional regulator n=1 Tax=Rathayibacter soli TaxID=3144168 RepID=UPI0027E4119A|nr:LacI family DNA-binding transcriptional regulator [Glaciibacter superstes]
MTSLRDVAKAAGVSTATVARVLDNTAHVSAELADRVGSVVTELGYVRNAVAKSLSTGRTGLIGVLVRDITNPFYSQVVRGIEDVVGSGGYLVLVCSSDFDEDREQRLISRFMTRLVDGVALSVGSEGEERLERMAEHGVPVVLFDSRVARRAGSLISAIGIDNYDAGFRAAMHLVSLGHTNLAVLAGAGGGTTASERRDGFFGACLETGVQVQGFAIDESLGVIGGVRTMMDALSGSPRPTGVFAYNNLFTVGAVQAARAMRMRIPDDVSLIGFDDMDLFNMMDPPLSVLAQPAYDIGTRVGERLLLRIGGESGEMPDEVLKAELTLRGSTGRVRSASGSR